jgi:diguanylate cyclase (GGDEF)-like protein
VPQKLARGLTRRRKILLPVHTPVRICLKDGYTASSDPQLIKEVITTMNERRSSGQGNTAAELLEQFAQSLRGGGDDLGHAILEKKIRQGIALWADLSTDQASALIGEPKPNTESLDRTPDVQTLLDELCALTLSDGLTGLGNRRFFDQRLEYEIQRVHRDFAPCSLLLADLDFFKSINDRYGHDAGDRALKATALALRVTLRQTDIVCRFGGEEFAAILPATGIAEAIRAAERLRQAVDRLPLPFADEPTPLSVSVGVSALFPTMDKTGSQLIKEADQALYRAKDNGRNRVELSETPPATSTGVSAEEKDELFG